MAGTSKYEQAETRKKMFSDAIIPRQVKIQGRPSSYNPDFCETVLECGARGDFPVQMATEIGISVLTLYNWARDHHEFAEAFQLAKQAAYSWWIQLAKDNVLNKEFNTALYNQITRVQRGSLGFNARHPQAFKDAPDFRSKLAVVDELFVEGLITLPEAEKLYGMVEKYVKIIDSEEIAKTLHDLVQDRKAKEKDAKKSMTKQK